MAGTAGSVAPVFRAEGYVATNIYDFYHAIIHNNKLYFCRQDGTVGHEPTGITDEYWFLSLDGNFGDATKLGGESAAQWQTKIDVEKARIDALITLEESGELTDIEKEVNDIKVGADGVTYGSAGTAVREQISSVKSDLIKNTYIKIDGEMKYHSDSYEDGILKMVISERDKTIDDKAFGDYTYRDLFNGSKNLLYPMDFETGSFSPAEIGAGNPTITNEDYKTKPYSLKAFGESSQQIKAHINFKNGHTYYFACFVNVTRYVQGYAGMLFGSSINIGVNNVTDGYVLKSAIWTFEKDGNDTAFIGTWSSANADAFVDNPVIIDLTELSATKEEVETLLLEYVELCNVETTTLKFATLESESNKCKKDSVYVGAIMGANSADDRFLAMKELFDICIGKNNTLTKANYGAVCELPNLNPSMLQNFELPIIYGKNETTQAVPASTTKVMTLITGLDYISNLKENVTIKAVDFEKGGIELNEGDIVTIEDLMYGMLLPSSNTCSLAFARVCGEKILVSLNNGGSYSDNECVSAFVEQMANKCAEIGMNDSVFESPSGKSENNLTTAKDLLKMMVEACSYNSIQKIWNKKNYTIHVKGANARDIDITTSVADETLESKFYIFGGKTGTLYLTNTHIALVAVVKPY